MRHPAWARLAAAATIAATAAGAATAGLSGFPTEEAALESLKEPGFSHAALEATDVDRLVHRGWHAVVRALVLRGHALGEEAAQGVATQVRQAVQAERNRLDDLIRVLDRNYGKAAEVSPAVQWAQNSTHAFLAVKFAQRWNAPGALEVENETVSISSCCVNFTAFGEHSFIKRRYHLSFELFRPLLPEASSWSLASVGRMSVTLAKEQAAKWPRLLSGANAAPKNLGIWRDMKEKWDSELHKFPPLADPGPTTSAAAASSPRARGPGAEKAKGTASKKGKAEKAKAADAEDGEEAGGDDEAVDREVELLSECAKASYAGTTVAELCSGSWRETVEEPRVRGRRWLVELYSSQGDGDPDAMKKLMPVWRRLADIFPSMVPGGRVGALDCGHDKELCRRLGVPMAKLPQVRRFLGGGSGEAWTGDLGASIEELAAFGEGRGEL